LTEAEAIAVARDVALRSGWPWTGPVVASFKTLVDRRPEWRVQAGRVCVIIDDASGHPFVKAIAPPPKWLRRRKT
jgi:hypothetical protein